MRMWSKSLLGLVACGAAATAAAENACIVLTPDTEGFDVQLPDTCKKGFVCQLDPCAGWIKVIKGSGPVQVVYRDSTNRSRVVEVSTGELFLADLVATGTLSSGIRNLINALTGDPEQRTPAGRYAIQPKSSSGAPSGPIAVFADTGLSFSLAGAAAGAAYVFHPQDDASAVTRVIAGDDGEFRIDAGRLPAGGRFRGGLEGQTLVAFQVAGAEKLGAVAAELAAEAPLSAAGNAYRRALIFSDNGLAWNARRELDRLNSK